MDEQGANAARVALIPTELPVPIVGGAPASLTAQDELAARLTAQGEDHGAVLAPMASGTTADVGVRLARH
jgi:hypothetical protein